MIRFTAFIDYRNNRSMSKDSELVLLQIIIDICPINYYYKYRHNTA